MTPRMKQLLDYLKAREAAGEVPPSFDEIMAEAGFRSKSNIHRVLKCLEERGAITQLRGHARTIKVVDRGPPSFAEYNRVFQIGYSAGLRDGRAETGRGER